MNNEFINYPQRVVCMTEESVEVMYLLGLEDRIVGVSAYAVRPSQVSSKPKVTAFISANINKVLALKPDLVLGFSDIQKDIAKDLIGAGVSVYIANHRSLSEILSYIQTLGAMLGEQQKAEQLVSQLTTKIDQIKEVTSKLSQVPKVYFEEWDKPRITAIRWVSEAIELSGGVDIFENKSKASLAKDRFIEDDQQIIDANPDIIFGCWCGKKVNIDSIKDRKGWSHINAVKNNQVHELDPAIFLQPGPAVILDGLDIFQNYFKNFLNTI